MFACMHIRAFASSVSKHLHTSYVTLSVYDPRVKSTLAARRQVPLKVAFAMTIHKAQGMTMDYVNVDCHLINRPGQLGVAIGRVTSQSCLRIVNFNTASCCVSQPPSVYNFYAAINQQSLYDDFSFFKGKIVCTSGMTTEYR